MRHALMAIVSGILCGLLIPMPWSFIIAGVCGWLIGRYTEEIDKFFGWRD